MSADAVEATPPPPFRSRVRFWAVVSDSTEEAVELFATLEEAEAVVQAWDRDAPDQAGALRVEKIEFRTGTAQQPAAPPQAVPGIARQAYVKEYSDRTIERIVPQA
jgi:hypothetical protein